MRNNFIFLLLFILVFLFIIAGEYVSSSSVALKLKGFSTSHIFYKIDILVKSG